MDPCINEPSSARDRHVIRCRLVHPIAEELPQAERIRRTPRDPPLAIKTFKETDQHQPEVNARRQRWPTCLVGVKRPALLFAEVVEFSFDQYLIKLPVERMSWRFRQLCPV